MLVVFTKCKSNCYLCPRWAWCWAVDLFSPIRLGTGLQSTQRCIIRWLSEMVRSSELNKQKFQASIYHVTNFVSVTRERSKVSPRKPFSAGRHRLSVTQRYTVVRYVRNLPDDLRPVLNDEAAELSSDQHKTITVRAAVLTPWLLETCQRLHVREIN